MNFTWTPTTGTAILVAAGWFLAAYLLGSIPVAWLVTKVVKKQDIRQLGSGNVGVMNTAISTARWAGLVVFVSEIAKGVLAVTIPRSYGAGEEIISLTVIAVVLGTRFPVWLRFKGGRGNTAGMGAILVISWEVMVYLAALWFLARLLTRESFQATRFTLFMLPLVIGLQTRSWWYVFMAVVLLLLYLDAQRRGSDDHLLLKEHYPSFWNFLTSPPRSDYFNRHDKPRT